MNAPNSLTVFQVNVFLLKNNNEVAGEWVVVLLELAISFKIRKGHHSKNFDV